MSAHLIAAGVSAGGALWGVDAERKLILYDATPLDRRLRHALTKPLPGAARPLALDGLAMLTAREVLRLNVRGQAWIPFNFKTQEDSVQNSEFVAAWPVDAGAFVGLDGQRRLWGISGSGVVSAFAALPIPGSASILAVNAEKAQALLADGTRLGWFGSRWVALGAQVASEDGAAVSMRVRATTAFCVEAGKDLDVGDVAELPEKRALELISRGWVEPVVEPVSA